MQLKRKLKCKTFKKTYRDYIDYLFLTYIILRDKKCFYCLRPAYTGHHIFAKGRIHTHLRYNETNVIGICRTHHGVWHGVHIYPDKYREAIIKTVDDRFGKGTYEKLRVISYMPASKVNLEMIEIYYIEKLKEHKVNFPKDYTKWANYKKKKFLKELRSSLA